MIRFLAFSALAATLCGCIVAPPPDYGHGGWHDAPRFHGGYDHGGGWHH